MLINSLKKIFFKEKLKKNYAKNIVENIFFRSKNQNYEKMNFSILENLDLRFSKTGNFFFIILVFGVENIFFDKKYFSQNILYPHQI